MVKRFRFEFKQQAIDYPLSNSHESVAAIIQKLRVDYSTLNKWIRKVNPTGSSKRQLDLEKAADLRHSEIFCFKTVMLNLS